MRLLVTVLLCFGLTGCSCGIGKEDKRGVLAKAEDLVVGREAGEKNRQDRARVAVLRERKLQQARLIFDNALRNPIPLPVATPGNEYAYVAEGQGSIRIRIVGDKGWTMWLMRPMQSGQFIWWTNIDRPVKCQVLFSDDHVVEFVDKPGLIIDVNNLYAKKHHAPPKNGVFWSAVRLMAEPTTNGMEIPFWFNRRP